MLNTVCGQNCHQTCKRCCQQNQQNLKTEIKITKLLPTRFKSLPDGPELTANVEVPYFLNTTENNLWLVSTSLCLMATRPEFWSPAKGCIF